MPNEIYFPEDGPEIQRTVYSSAQEYIDKQIANGVTDLEQLASEVVGDVCRDIAQGVEVNLGGRGLQYWYVDPGRTFQGIDRSEPTK